MKRIAVLVAVIAILAAAFFLNAGRTSDITIVNARAILLGGQSNNFAVTFEVQNEGAAKKLLAIQSTSARMAHVMNPGYDGAALVIPENSSGIFAMDGAHAMLIGAGYDFVEGASIPITLTFEGFGDVTTRVLNAGNEAGMDGMDHDRSSGIRLSQPPTVEISAPDGIGANGAEITVNVENFAFARLPDDAPHVPMEGHAHIYLNGLKLGRLYEPSYTLGAVLDGSYELMISLNSNTHQPYLNDDGPVSSVIAFEVD